VIVIDTSALAKYLLREQGWLSVERYLAGGVYSVDHIVKEVANAIWKHSIIHGRINRELAFELYSVLRKLVGTVVVLEPQDKYLDEAVRIAFEKRITVYDALYVAQALDKGELLTADSGHAKAARSLRITVYEV
jgi:predicted nucleic acid-binding protein